MRMTKKEREAKEKWIRDAPERQRAHEEWLRGAPERQRIQDEWIAGAPERERIWALHKALGKEAADRIYPQMTTAEKDHLAKAMQQAVRSEREGNPDDWRCALGNLNRDTPNFAGGRVTRAHVREMLATLEELRRDPRVYWGDWQRLLNGAFEDTDRFDELYGYSLQGVEPYEED